MRALLLLILVAVLLAVFNPGMEDFQEFVRDRSGELVSSQVGEGGLGGFLSGLGGSLAASNVRRITKRKNYYVFSTYTLDLPGEENDWKFLGIATQFIELQRPEALKNDK